MCRQGENLVCMYNTSERKTSPSLSGHNGLKATRSGFDGGYWLACTPPCSQLLGARWGGCAHRPCTSSNVCVQRQANYSASACISSLGSHNKLSFFSVCSTVLLLMFCHGQFVFFFFFFHLSFVCCSAQIIPARSQFRLRFHRSRSTGNFSDFIFGCCWIRISPQFLPFVFFVFFGFCQGQRWL